MSLTTGTSTPTTTDTTGTSTPTTHSTTTFDADRATGHDPADPPVRSGSGGRGAIALLLAGAVAVGALVTAVLDDGPETSTVISSHGVADANRAGTLSDINRTAAGSHDTVDANRAAVLSDLAGG